MSELDEDYWTETQDEEISEINEALLSDTIRTLVPDEPLCVRGTMSIKDAVDEMMAMRRAAVLVVDADGRLEGIFTERDVLTRVVARAISVATPVADVMTRDPEALSVTDRVAYAVNRMSVAGYRTIPLIDGARRPIGVVTVNHFIKWMANLFPEAVLNLRPGDAIKRPTEVDSG